MKYRRLKDNEMRIKLDIIVNEKDDADEGVRKALKNLFEEIEKRNKN